MKEVEKLPKGWTVAKLGELVITEKGKKPKHTSKEKNKECPIPYVNIKAFEKNIIDEYTDGVGCVICEDDDFLMVWDGSRSGYVGKAIKGALGSTLVRIKLPLLNQDYVYYFLQSKFREINTRAKGVGIPHVDPYLLWNYDFPIAPLPEQTRILAKLEQLFTDLDKGIEYLKTAQQQLKVYRQAVLKWAFEGNNSKDFILKDLSTKIQIGPFGTQLHKEDYILGGVPLINPMHIRNGKIVADPSFSISKEKSMSLPNYLLTEGDIIMGRRGEMSRCGLVTANEDGWFCGTGSLYIRPKQAVVCPKFLYYLLSNDTTKKYLELNAGGTTMANLNLKIINNIPISLPSLLQQQKIVSEIESRLSVCDKIEETIENSLQQAEALRLSIIKKAFEGKLVPQDPKDEPAEKLLERIRAAKTKAAPAGRKVNNKKSQNKTTSSVGAIPIQ